MRIEPKWIAPSTSILAEDTARPTTALGETFHFTLRPKDGFESLARLALRAKHDAGIAINFPLYLGGENEVAIVFACG